MNLGPPIEFVPGEHAGLLVNFERDVAADAGSFAEWTLLQMAPRIAAEYFGWVGEDSVQERGARLHRERLTVRRGENRVARLPIEAGGRPCNIACLILFGCDVEKSCGDNV